MSVWVILLKVGILIVAAELAIRTLSRYRAGDTSEQTNHRRGWFLVGIMTVVALGLAWFV